MYQAYRSGTIIVALIFCFSEIAAQRDSLHFDIGSAEKVFGPGGMFLQTEGVTQTEIGITRSKTGNPFLSEKNRNRTFFRFDQKIHVNTQATLGNKVNFQLNYTTEERLKFDPQALQLTYRGHKNEILTLLEAGNIRMYSSNSWIQYPEELFGIQAKLQFGKLHVNTLFAGQQSGLTFPSAPKTQNSTFELTAIQYDENRHFFLSHYFREQYDNALENLPLVKSDVCIQKAEVWVSNTIQTSAGTRDITAETDQPEIVETVPHARKLDESEYTLNRTLGYLSLTSALESDAVLAIAYSYTYKGEMHQEGKFCTDNSEIGTPLHVKLLKARLNTPASNTWQLMMKNIYSLPGGSLSKTNFRLEILFKNTSGMLLPYLPYGQSKGHSLLHLLKLDQLDIQGKQLPDGHFDFMEGYTVQSENGLIIFPVTEPFGAYLAEQTGDETAVFRELYDSTRIAVLRLPEKDRFILRGKYTFSKSDSLVDLRQDSYPRETQQHILTGIDLNYKINKRLNLGTTVMRYAENSRYIKTTIGEEPISNTLIGSHLSYRDSIGKDKPSLLSFSAEWARLIPGKTAPNGDERSSYLDDFESTRHCIDLLNPQAWTLASDPFAEPELSTPTNYGKNRALFAWYTIDRMFTHKGASGMPSHLQNDNEQLSFHSARAVNTTELFPDKEVPYNAEATLPILNLAFYPEERGPYNLDATAIQPDGALRFPEKRWGAIMRKTEESDFEAANIEYIECWLMDPFIHSSEKARGDLYFELGDISEEVLKDGKAFAENGLPTDKDESKVDFTAWGKVPKISAIPYVFENKTEIRKLQDVGLNGLSSEAEKEYPTYRNYLSQLRQKLSTETISRMEQDPFSPLNDPAGDLYHSYRGVDYDRTQTPITDRYKHYNGTEGNSSGSGESPGEYSFAARALPDIEDINQDNSLTNTENYYQYHVSIRPETLVSGTNYITDKRTTLVKLENGSEVPVNWYQLKIPLAAYSKRIGKIHDFKSIRFIRLVMTGFQKKIILRLGTLELTGGEWRKYEPDEILKSTAVSLEENSDRSPVNYVLPPDIERIKNRVQPHAIQENEQALALKITNLLPTNTRAVYKNTSYDLRLYKTLQLRIHAEAPKGEGNLLENGDLSIFIRLGSDFNNNYYEYEMPLTLTPHGKYANTNRIDREMVWPDLNYLKLTLEKLTALKLKRNRIKQTKSSIPMLASDFKEPDPEQPRNTLCIHGNPALSDIKVIVIGIKNCSDGLRSGEVWINELRLSNVDKAGGWGINTSLGFELSDIGSVQATGTIETNGFGGLTQSASERNENDRYQYAIDSSIELGKLLSKKKIISFPVSYNYKQEANRPRYTPFDPDILLTDAIHTMESKQKRDSIRRISAQRVTSTGVSVDQARILIQSKYPMPYDPANFSIGYSFVENKEQQPEVELRRNIGMQGYLQYIYAPPARPFYPFKNKLSAFEINYLPTSVSFQSYLSRNKEEMRWRNILEGDSLLPSYTSEQFFRKDSYSIQWNPVSQFILTYSSEAISQQADNQKRMAHFTGTYQVPFQLIPCLKWAHASFLYTSDQFRSQRMIPNEEKQPDKWVQKQRRTDINGWIQMKFLYKKIAPFLKNIHVNWTRTDALLRSGMLPYQGDFSLLADISGPILPGVEITNQGKTLRVRTALEPASDLKIELNLQQNRSVNSEIQRKYPEVPPLKRERQSYSTIGFRNLLESTTGIPCLPNWNVSYKGIKNILLTHQYRCTYELEKSLFSNCSTITSTEGFYPLVGVDASFPNHITGRIAYTVSKQQHLNRIFGEIKKTQVKEVTVSTGYKVKLPTRKIKNKKWVSNECVLLLQASTLCKESGINTVNGYRATEGNKGYNLQVSANYIANSGYSIRTFYSLLSNKPTVSISSFSSSECTFGISFQFELKL